MMSIPQDRPLRAILWIAVSSLEQAKEGKESLPSQERELRQVAEREGWTIVDVLVTPGHSRRYYNLLEFAAAAREENIDSGDKLLKHLQAADFDVFACRDGSRFGRGQGIFGEIVERIIDTGARLFTLTDKWIDPGNYRMFTSMVGYSAATHVDFLQKAYTIGMPKRVSKGLPASQLPITHMLERDEKGQPIRAVVNPKYRRLFEDAAQLLLDGVGWGAIPRILYERFGHVNKNGKPYSHTTFRNIFYSPWTWGHSAHKYVRTTGKRPYNYTMRFNGTWVFDEDIPLPPEVQVYRNTCEPLFTGDKAEQIKAELRRRIEIVKGRAGFAPKMFSGLLICDSCGCRMTYHHVRGWSAYQCCSDTAAHRYFPRAACDMKKRTINEKYVQKWLDANLRLMLEAADPLWFDHLSQSTDNPNQRADQLRAEVQDIEKRISGLILQRADTPPTSQYILTQLLEGEDKRLQILKAQLGECETRVAANQRASASAQQAYDTIKQQSIDGFWQLPRNEINRLLLQALGKNRLVVRDGEIIGVVKY